MEAVNDHGAFAIFVEAEGLDAAIAYLEPAGWNVDAKPAHVEAYLAPVLLGHIWPVESVESLEWRAALMRRPNVNGPSSGQPGPLGVAARATESPRGATGRKTDPGRGGAKPDG